MLATYFVCYYLDNEERVYSTVAVALNTEDRGVKAGKVKCLS